MNKSSFSHYCGQFNQAVLHDINSSEPPDPFFPDDKKMNYSGMRPKTRIKAVSTMTSFYLKAAFYGAGMMLGKEAAKERRREKISQNIDLTEMRFADICAADLKISRKDADYFKSKIPAELQTEEAKDFALQEKLPHLADVIGYTLN